MMGIGEGVLLEAGIARKVEWVRIVVAVVASSGPALARGGEGSGE